MVRLKQDIMSVGHTEIYPESDYIISKKGGDSLIGKCPIFSKDGEFLFVISKNVIRVHNVKTSDLIRRLELASDARNIVSAGFKNEDGHTLIACSEDGNVYEWDWNNGVCVSERVLQLQDCKQVLSFDILDEKQALLTASSGFNMLVNLTIVNYITGSVLREIENNGLKIMDSIWSVAIGCGNHSEQFVAICNGSPYLFTFNLTKFHIPQKHKNYNNVPLLCAAAHPVNSCVVVGDAIGRVIVMYGDFDKAKNLKYEVLHWHQLPLSALAFSQQGSFLLSGGMEQVLVKWTPGAQYNRVFMPRLPGQIRHIAIDKAVIAISTSNNSIQIINPQLYLKATILESGGLADISGLQGLGLLYHTPSSSLILGSHSGHLSMFSTLTNRLLYNVDITMMNRIPPERENWYPADMEVICAAVSPNGRWLVTSEYRKDKVNASEERLKFWSTNQHQDNNQTASPFILNTCINLSHRGALVNEIALSKNGDMCLTAGSDDKFRLWTTHETFVSGLRRISWKCLAVCYYYQYLGYVDKLGYENNIETDDIIMEGTNGDVSPKIDELVETLDIKAKNCDMKLGKVALSEDGSVVAAWWGAKLGLWNTSSCDVRAFLAHPALTPKGKDVKFGCNDSAHYIVCTTDDCLAVWHLLFLSLTWVVKMNPISLTADPLSNKMVVITKENDVYIFKPQSSQYLLRKRRVLDPTHGLLSTCVFAETDKNNLRLYFLRNQQEIYCLEPKEKNAEHSLEHVSAVGTPMSNFSALLAQTRINEVKAHVKADRSLGNWGLVGMKAVDELLASSSHTLPPMSLLNTSFIEALAGSKKNELETHSDADASSVSEDEVESDVGDNKPNQLQGESYEEKKLCKNIVRLSDIEKSLSAIGNEHMNWVNDII